MGPTKGKGVNLKKVVHQYVALLKQLGAVRFSLVLAFSLIAFDTILQWLMMQLVPVPIDGTGLLRSVFLGILITPWVVYFLSVVVNDLDRMREQLSLTVQRLEEIAIADKNKTAQLEKEVEVRQRALRQLQDSEVLLQSFLNTSPDLFFHRDLVGNFVSCNNAMARFTGLTEAQVIGLSPKDIYPAEYAKVVNASDIKVIATQEEVIHAHWLTSPNGQATYFEIRVLPLINHQRECIGVIGFGRDITERKKNEEHLEQVSRDKTAFISTVSHELRTPLNGIVGLSRMLLDGKLTAEQTQYLKTIHMSAITLGNIFNDIIDLDKLDRKRLNVVNEQINTQDFLNDLQSLATIQAEQKKLAFVFQQGSDLPMHIFSDATRLRQVLWNLLTNAVKFTDSGKISITCHYDMEKKPDEITFSFQDTGIGIHVDQLDKIFAMYYQVNTASHATGTGIGLAVSRHIVDAMNGQLSVQSQVGKGSCFTLRLPVNRTGFSLPQRIASYPTLQILLVEDIELNVLVARALLEKLGHRVDVAANGLDAIAKAEAVTYQLILMDIQLPDIDGFAITQHLRDTHTVLPPIVALTANVFSDVQDYLDKGMDDALGKPLTASLFNAMLKRVFPGTMSPLCVEGPQEEPLCVQNKSLNTDMLKELMAFLSADAMLDNVVLLEEVLPEYLLILESHIIDKNKAGIVSQAHKIKSAAASVGLLRIQTLAEKLQSSSLPAWWDNINDWHLLMKSCQKKDIQRVKDWIVSYE